MTYDRRTAALIARVSLSNLRHALAHAVIAPELLREERERMQGTVDRLVDGGQPEVARRLMVDAFRAQAGPLAWPSAGAELRRLAEPIELASRRVLPAGTVVLTRAGDLTAAYCPATGHLIAPPALR